MTKDIPFRALVSDDDLQEALSHSEERAVVLFKHSATCGLSARAHDEMQQLAEETDTPIYCIVVQEARSVSNEIADRTGIRHESPQAILFQDGEPVFDASHHAVTAQNIHQALPSNEA